MRAWIAAATDCSSTGYIPSRTSPSIVAIFRDFVIAQRTSGTEDLGCRSLDRVVNLEQRHVHRDHDEADDAADDDDHHGLEDRRELLDRGLDLVLVELGDLRQHL